MANRFPLIVDSDTSTVKELPSGDNLDLTGNDAIFGDNDKAIFGAGSDLQIYHNSSHSIIEDVGTGSLRINGNNIELSNADYTENYLVAVNGANVQLYYNNNPKISTTNTGVDITGKATGDVTADNDGSFDLNSSNDFTCTPTGSITISFTNETVGQSGNILLTNTTPQVISVGADVFMAAGDLTTINVAGTYLMSYYCPDGTNVYLSTTPALTEGT